MKIHIRILILCSAALLRPALADNITGYLAQQWARQATTMIENDCLISWSGLYGINAGSTYPGTAWDQGVMLGANTAAAQLDSTYLTRATAQAQGLYDHFRCYYNGYWAYNASYNACGDRYYDDNAWLALGFLELFELSGNSTWLTRAQEIIKFCMSGENATGGIRWHESNTSGVSVCASAPTILANLMAYQLSGTESYLADGLRVYRFMMDDSGLLSDNGCFHENAQGALGYLSAVMTRAALRLHEITGDELYMFEARMMATGLDFVFLDKANESLGQFGKWGGHDMADAFVEMYEATGEQHWLNITAGYLEFLYVNCQDPVTGRCPPYWNDTSMSSISDALIENASMAKAFWTLARSPGGITNQSRFTNEMVGRWKLEETTGSSAWDSSINSNSAVLSGFTFDSSAASGPCGGALYLDGVDDHLQLTTDCSNFRSGITLSIWAYPTAAANWARFFDIGNGEYDNNIVFARQGTTTTVSFEAYNNGTTGGKVSAAGAIELNKWQLFTATIDAAGNAAIYKNGAVIASGKTALPPNIDRLYKYVGRSNWAADSYYKGSIDDVRIYNYALSADDIAALYILGGQAENPVPLMDATNVSSGVQMGWHAGSLADEHDVYIGTDSAAVSAATPDSQEYAGRQTSNKLYYPLAPGTKYYWRVDEVFGAETNIGRIWSFTTTALPAEKMAAHYSLESSFISGATAIDTSRSGTSLGAMNFGCSTGTAGAIGEALSFDGSTDYLDLPTFAMDLSDGFSTSMWVYPTAAASWARFLDFGNGAGVDNIVFGRDGTSDTLYITGFNGTSGGARVSATGAITLNTWQMLSAVIYPSGYAVVYKNGEVVGKGVTTAPANVSRINNYIGRSNWAADARYKGYMDEIGVWTRALSPEEIKAAYNRSIDGLPLMDLPETTEPAGSWRFNESGTTAENSAGASANGTLVNMDESNRLFGKQCGALKFNGSDEYVSINSFKAIAGGASRAVCAWIKTSQTGGEILAWGYPDAGTKWIVRLDDDGVLRVEVGSGYIIGSSVLSDGGWHHIAVSLESDTTPDINEALLYVDGNVEQISSAGGRTVDTAPATDMTIGVYGAVMDRFFEGLIDEVMLFDRALSAEAIYEIYASSALASDINGSGNVDMADFSSLSLNWLAEPETPIDITCDCIYDIDDLSVLAEEWLGSL